jgi:hypothetical protein
MPSPHRDSTTPAERARGRRDRNTAVSNRVSTLRYVGIAVALLVIGLAATTAGLVLGPEAGPTTGGLLLVVGGLLTLQASRVHNRSTTRDGVPSYAPELLWFAGAVVAAVSGFYLLGH